MRRAALCAAILMLPTFAAAAASAQDRISLTPAGASTFPQRSYRLTVPARPGLLAKDIKVSENGDPVSKVALTSADAARGGEFGAILVIDASASMHGGAIRGAIAAARELAKQRSGAQQLGIIVFNRIPKVLLAPTADQQAIDEALRQAPPLASQTRIFDAVDTALALLDQAHITAGSVVVLSDGSDTGSQVSADAVARRARRSNVSIFTVGLHSRAFDSGELKGLAAAGHGRYVAAGSVSDLRRIFHELGAQLASDYLVEYRSFAKPGRDVSVTIRAAGVSGIAMSTYRVPGGATFVQIKHGFWTSGLGVAVTALLCTLLLATGLAILLVRRTQGPTVRERIRGFVSMPGDLSPSADMVLAARARSGAERSLEGTKWWAAFKQDVEIARITLDPMRIVTVAAFATLVVAYLLIASTGIGLVGLFALAIPWGARTWVGVRRDRQRALFVDQLPDLLQGAASAIRAGHGLVAALSMVAEEASEPTRAEFLRVVADEALGVPLEEALRGVQERMDSREVLQIALVAQIQREAGGNMAEVLDRITDAVRQRGELRRMVKALTAQGRLSRWVVSALPLILLLGVTVTNPAYVAPLFTETVGLAMLGIAAMMMLFGSLVIGKIVDFKV